MKTLVSDFPQHNDSDSNLFLISYFPFYPADLPNFHQITSHSHFHASHLCHPRSKHSPKTFTTKPPASKFTKRKTMINVILIEENLWCKFLLMVFEWIKMFFFFCHLQKNIAMLTYFFPLSSWRNVLESERL